MTDLRYSYQRFSDDHKVPAIEFDHAQDDKFTRVAWIPAGLPLDPWNLRNLIETRGFSADDVAQFNQTRSL